MFAVFLKAKQEIQAKLSQLQRTYLALISHRIRPLEFNTTNDSDAVAEIICEKLEKLQTIKDEYERVHHQCVNTANALSEARETGELTEKFIDELFAVLRIEIPSSIIEEFTNEDAESSQEHENSSSTLANTLEEDKENSRSYQEEEDDVSDKENEYRTNPSPDSEYFSPNVLISKSMRDTNVSCYTPAIKSHSKLPVPLSIAKLRKLQL